jgi:hypothetical protein
MARTRQEARADPSPMHGREYGSLYGNENEGEPLMDTASHQPAASVHSERGESGGHQDDPVSHREEVLLPGAAGGQGPEDRSPLVAPTVTPR